MKQAVCILIVDDIKNLFLSVSLKEDHSDMNMPGGKVEPNESLIEASIREVKEETGFDVYNLEFMYQGADKNFNVVTYYTNDFKGKLATQENHVVRWLPLIHLTKSKQWTEYNTIIYNLYNNKFKKLIKQ